MKTFVGIDIGEATRARIGAAIIDLAKLAPRARWVLADSLHITLVFLGWVEQPVVARVESEMARVARHYVPFDLEIRGGRSFGKRRSPRTLWTGVDGDLATLGAIQAELTRAIATTGAATEDRAFSPHVTLARARDPKGDPALAACAEVLGEEKLVAFHVAEMVLYESVQFGGKSQYRKLFEARLG